MQTICMDWQCLKNIKKTLKQFKEYFIKNYDGNSDIGYFLEVDAEYPKHLFNFQKDLPFYPKERKSKNAISLFVSFSIKKICCSHKCFKTCTKAWINTKESAQSNSI